MWKSEQRKTGGLLFRAAFFLVVFPILFLVPGASFSVLAQIKEAPIAELEREQELAVVFTFDRSVVDLTFISPSGQRLTKDDANVEYAEGELWATYRIAQAEQGQWSVEYDLQQNTEIAYSVLEETQGIWIQYLNVGEISGSRLQLGFEADSDSGDISYEYFVYALPLEEGEAVELDHGTALANGQKVTDVSLARLPDGSYAIKLEVSYAEGEGEVFDSFVGDTIVWENEAVPEPIENFAVRIDRTNLTLEADWADYRPWGCSGYKIVVTADGTAVYRDEPDRDESAATVIFPRDTQKLDISLYYKEDAIWSRPLTKTVDLTQEFMVLESGEVVGSSQVSLRYKVLQERELEVTVNGESGNCLISGEGTLFLDIGEGSNEISAVFASENQVSFLLEADVYRDAVPPQIKLYDDIDGKTFYTDEVTLLGKVTGGSRFTINGEEAVLDETGAFAYACSLNLGENVIELEAADVNGNAAKMALTVYKGSKLAGGEDTRSGWRQFLPLLLSLAASAVVALLAVLFMKKKEKKPKSGKQRVWPWFVWDALALLAEIGCVWQFITRYFYSHSMKYFELAEKSVSDAAEYLKWEKFLGIAALAGAGVLGISALLTAIVKKRAAKADAGKQ